jgi:glutamine synthetase
MIAAPNNLSVLLDKPKSDFTRDDIKDAVRRLGIRMVNFRFVAGDGRLRTFSFVVQSQHHLDRILTAGERIDGSSIFRYMDAGRSDLYVVPAYRKAFINPFAHVPTLDVMCAFFDSAGLPLATAPENILRRAATTLSERTGYSLECHAELEFYLVSTQPTLYPGTAQRGYGQSAPFSNWESVRTDAMVALADMGFPVKYGHNEVGKIHESVHHLEQHEIEFALMDPEDSADAVVLARWVLRMASDRRGVTATFAPKLVHGLAGSGMHVHARLVKDGRNATADDRGITDAGKKQLAGMLSLARSLTAFGNTVPISYLRLVPNQEAPVFICWGERNRCALVRVPLGWRGVADMAASANPNDPTVHTEIANNTTVELRSPDGSADAHMLHAGLLVATRHGLEMQAASDLVDKLRITANIFLPEYEEFRTTLPKLPGSCRESATALVDQRAVYEQYGVFPPAAIDGVAQALRGFGDEERSIAANFEELHSIINKYMHCA